MRVGLFGGSFNPIHNCHIQIAELVRDRMQLDRVLFIPTGHPPHKVGHTLASAQHRYEMVRLAIEQEPTFALSDIEIQRTGKSYSIDTVHALRQQYGSGTDLFFLIGLDAFLDLPSWKQAETLLTSCHFVVVSRPGTPFMRLTTLALLPPTPSDALASLDQHQRDRLDIPLAEHSVVTLLPVPPCEVSASDIRAQLSRQASLAKVLPPPVESYIIRSGLYREDVERSGS